MRPKSVQNIIRFALGEQLLQHRSVPVDMLDILQIHATNQKKNQKRIINTLEKIFLKEKKKKVCLW